MGLAQKSGAHSPAECRAVCCVTAGCTTWQWSGARASGAMANTCWVGDWHSLVCANDTEGWTTAARKAGPTPAQA